MSFILPPARVFIVLAHRVYHGQRFVGCLWTSIFLELGNVTLARFPLVDFYAKAKSPYIYEYVLGETRSYGLGYVGRDALIKLCYIGGMNHTSPSLFWPGQGADHGYYMILYFYYSYFTEPGAPTMN